MKLTDAEFNVFVDYITQKLLFCQNELFKQEVSLLLFLIHAIFYDKVQYLVGQANVFSLLILASRFWDHVNLLIRLILDDLKIMLKVVLLMWKSLKNSNKWKCINSYNFLKVN